MTNETTEPKTQSIAEAIAQSKAAIETGDAPKRKRGRPRKSESSPASLDAGANAPGDQSDAAISPKHSREAISAVIGITETVAVTATGFEGWKTEQSERAELSEALGKYLDVQMPGGDLSPGWGALLAVCAVYVPRVLQFQAMRRGTLEAASTPRESLDLSIPEQRI